MKMPKDLFELIKAKIQPLNTEERIACYIDGKFSGSHRIKTQKDLHTRLAWDLFWMIQGQGNDIYMSLSFLNDSHIETALKQIVPSIPKRF
jgi:hypothetical protein